MEPVASAILVAFLARLGDRCDREARLYLLGGSALLLLGSPRETLDVDYTADVPLEEYFRAILPRAGRADIDPKEFQAYFGEIRRRYSHS